MLLPAINTFAPASAAFTNVSAFTPPSSDRYFKMGYLFAIDLSLMSTSHWNLTLAAPAAASGCNNDIMLSDTTCTSCISWGHDLCMAATLWDAIGQAVSTRGPYKQLLHLSAHGKKLPVWASCTNCSEAKHGCIVIIMGRCMDGWVGGWSYTHIGLSKRKLIYHGDNNPSEPGGTRAASSLRSE
jgi:hypothetical protein